MRQNANATARPSCRQMKKRARSGISRPMRQRNSFVSSSKRLVERLDGPRLFHVERAFSGGTAGHEHPCLEPLREKSARPAQRVADFQRQAGGEILIGEKNRLDRDVAGRRVFQNEVAMVELP